MEDCIFKRTPIRCLRLWFEDGDVTIVAGYVAFRVHKHKLLHGSSVLADTEWSEDGVTRIHLEETVYDVKHLLHMLYSGVE